MKLTTKLVVAFMLVIVVIACVDVYLNIRREVREFGQSAMRGAVSVVAVLEPIVVQLWPDRGLPGVEAQLEQLSQSQEQMRIRWVFLDSSADEKHQPKIAVSELVRITIPLEMLFQSDDTDGNGYLEIYRPILVADRKGALEIAHSTSDLQTAKQEIVRVAVIRTGLSLLLVGLIFALLGMRIVGRPLQRLIEKMRRAASGDLLGPVVLKSHDELAELAASLNDMCTKLDESHANTAAESKALAQAQEQLRHADRLQTVGRLAAGVAHELGTPLAVVSGRASLIASGRLSPDDVQASAAIIRSEADRMATTIKQLLSFARRDQPRRQRVDLQQIVANTFEMVGSLARERKVELTLHPPPQSRAASVDVAQFQQLATNLVVNAIQSMPNGGRVDVTFDEMRLDEQSNNSPPGIYQKIQVADQGTGIAEEHRQHVFEPFFTTKEVGKGTGLGLPIALGIAQDHGGWIDFTSTQGVGSCFCVYIPIEANA